MTIVSSFAAFTIEPISKESYVPDEMVRYGDPVMYSNVGLRAISHTYYMYRLSYTGKAG